MNNTPVQHVLFGTCPKPFIQPFDKIQHQTISAMKKLKHENVKTHIVLLGDEEGIKEARELHQVVQVPNIRLNDEGTPIVSDLFEKLQKLGETAKDNVVCCFCKHRYYT